MTAPHGSQQPAIRVLVVEDDPVAADAHALYVGRMPGFELAGIAHSGEEARRHLERAGARRGPGADHGTADNQGPGAGEHAVDGRGAVLDRSASGADLGEGTPRRIATGPRAAGDNGAGGAQGAGANDRRATATEHAPVDLLLLDLYLPDGHGLRLVRSLRAAGHAADVIAVTSARDLAVVREGVSLGVVQYVLKPFSFATLRDRLVRYAEFRAAAGEASGQDEVDRALASLRAPQPASLPKGLSGPTLEAVTRVLRGSGPRGVTASAAGEAVGISRITARRYLEHLVTAGRAERTPQYGQIGRPELCYRWVRG